MPKTKDKKAKKTKPKKVVGKDRAEVVIETMPEPIGEIASASRLGSFDSSPTATTNMRREKRIIEIIEPFGSEVFI